MGGGVMGGQIQDELLTYLRSSELVDTERVKAIVFSNPCLFEVSEGLNGKTYRIGTAIDANGNCNDFLLVKVAKQRAEIKRADMIDGLRREAKLQSELYTVIKSFDDDGTTYNAKMLIPQPLKLQDDFFFMQFLSNSKTLFDVLPDLIIAQSAYIFSILLQVSSFFAMVEEKYNPNFRHGDLHPYNVLVSNLSLVKMKFGTSTVVSDYFATVIDFGYATIDKFAPLDIVFLIMYIIIQLTPSDETLEGYLAALRHILWTRVMRPLFSPFMIPVDPSSSARDEISTTNFNAIYDYFFFRENRLTNNFKGKVIELMKRADFVHPDFVWDATRRAPQTLVVLKSIDVTQLLMQLVHS
jgi:hypothetical protein